METKREDLNIYIARDVGMQRAMTLTIVFFFSSYNTFYFSGIHGHSLHFGCNSPSFYLNKRPMGHIAHLRKQFKSINTYAYIITLIKKRKKHIIDFRRINWFFI